MKLYVNVSSSALRSMRYVQELQMGVAYTNSIVSGVCHEAVVTPCYTLNNEVLLNESHFNKKNSVWIYLIS